MNGKGKSWPTDPRLFRSFVSDLKWQEYGAMFQSASSSIPLRMAQHLTGRLAATRRQRSPITNVIDLNSPKKKDKFERSGIETADDDGGNKCDIMDAGHDPGRIR